MLFLSTSTKNTRCIIYPTGTVVYTCSRQYFPGWRCFSYKLQSDLQLVQKREYIIKGRSVYGSRAPLTNPRASRPPDTHDPHEISLLVPAHPGLNLGRVQLPERRRAAHPPLGRRFHLALLDRGKAKAHLLRVLAEALVRAKHPPGTRQRQLRLGDPAPQRLHHLVLGAGARELGERRVRGDVDAHPHEHAAVGRREVEHVGVADDDGVAVLADGRDGGLFGERSAHGCSSQGVDVA